jgi:NAD(P)-dependent dehydrogenase (short-subunit alcohol dehydrogenase family)
MGRQNEGVDGIRTLIDEALEITVVGSFSALGYEARRRSYRWRRPDTNALAGQTVILTGPTSGLGRAAAGELAGLGARVVLVGRSATRLAAVRDELIRTHGEDRFPTVIADMASLDSVRAAVEAIVAGEPRIDVVVDNAGAISAERTESPDGIEATLATMVVGPFALISGLLPRLRATGRARVIAVTSGGMYAQRVDLDDLGWTRRPYSGPRAYAQAKRIQVALVREWARRIDPAEVTFAAMHPGWADTPGLAASLPGFHRFMGPILRTPAQGIDTLIWLAAHGPLEGRSGDLYLDRRRRPFDRIPATRLSAAERRRLWDAVAGLAGIDG